MRRLLLTPLVLAVLLAPALAGNEPSSATPSTPPGAQAGPAAPCECGGGPGKCCGQATAAPKEADDKAAAAPSCGCAAARSKAEKGQQ